jgi:hypothetical protein
MNRTYRLGIVLLSAAMTVALTGSQLAVAQRIKGSGGSSQGNQNKDKDSDDDQKDGKKNKDNQGNRNNQNNQGNQNKQGSNQTSQNNQNIQGGNSSKSGNSNKSSNRNVPQQFQPFIQGSQGKNRQGQAGNQDQNNSGQNNPGQDDQGQNKQGQNIPGQGNLNRFKDSNKSGVPGQPFPQQQIDRFKDKDAFKDKDDDDRSKKLKIGVWQGDKWQGSRKIDNWSQVFGHIKKPFSAEWYNDHPRAWRYNNNRSNVYVVATLPGMYSWLGWGTPPPQYRVYYGNVEPFDPSIYGEWYPLGVYSLMTGPDDVGTRILQLAVDRRGRINGNYFDMITDSDHSVSGEIQQQTQRAEWVLNQNPNVRFRASILRLLQPYGTVTVRLPGGDQYWQFVRLEN